MFDVPLMLRVNLPVVDTIHPKCNKFAMGVKMVDTAEYSCEIYCMKSSKLMTTFVQVRHVHLQ